MLFFSYIYGGVAAVVGPKIVGRDVCKRLSVEDSLVVSSCQKSSA